MRPTLRENTQPIGYKSLTHRIRVNSLFYLSQFFLGNDIASFYFGLETNDFSLTKRSLIAYCRAKTLDQFDLHYLLYCILEQCNFSEAESIELLKEFFIHTGVSAIPFEKSGKCPLSIAYKKRRLVVCDYILKNPILMNPVNSYQRIQKHKEYLAGLAYGTEVALLYDVISSNNHVILKSMLKYLRYQNIAMGSHNFYLRYACQIGKSECVDVLLDLPGIRKNAHCLNNDALVKALQDGNLKIALMLMNISEVEDNADDILLLFPASFGPKKLDIVDYLIELRDAENALNQSKETNKKQNKSKPTKEVSEKEATKQMVPEVPSNNQTSKLENSENSENSRSAPENCDDLTFEMSNLSINNPPYLVDRGFRNSKVTTRSIIVSARNTDYYSKFQLPDNPPDEYLSESRNTKQKNT